MDRCVGWSRTDRHVGFAAHLWSRSKVHKDSSIVLLTVLLTKTGIGHRECAVSGESGHWTADRQPVIRQRLRHLGGAGTELGGDSTAAGMGSEIHDGIQPLGVALTWPW